MTRTIHLNLPASVDLSEYDLRLTLAARLYELGRLSLGQAADVAGLSKRAFIEVIGAYGVSVFGTLAEELGRDLDHA